MSIQRTEAIRYDVLIGPHTGHDVQTDVVAIDFDGADPQTAMLCRDCNQSITLVPSQVKRKSSGGGASFWKRFGKRLTKRDGAKCKYCGVAVSAGDGYSERMATVDHVTPRCKGGTNDLSNLVICCHSCNAKKGKK